VWIILDPAFDPAQPAADRYVRGDRRRLQQVLINLLSNVIKYNRANGRIDVGVVLADDTHLGVAVTDTGKGHRGGRPAPTVPALRPAQGSNPPTSRAPESDSRSPSGSPP